MCTNFVLIKKNGTTNLADTLGIDSNSLIYKDFKPGNTISIIRDGSGGRLVEPARWWLYLQQTDQGLAPHKDYFSVNTNYAKLPRKVEFRKTRCIIPASAFVESQAGKNPHLLEPEDGSAIAFGGLYKEWTDRVTGEVVHSASIITLKGHPSLENIHKKSTPLWLDEDLYDDWLNPEIDGNDLPINWDVPLLQTNLRATPIDKTYSKNPVGESFIVPSK